jgi:hypothetical protein
MMPRSALLRSRVGDLLDQLLREQISVEVAREMRVPFYDRFATSFDTSICFGRSPSVSVNRRSMRAAAPS